MQRKFITNLALLLFLNLLIKPFWIFGIDRTVQNLMGAEVYGKYYALLNFSFLLNILLDAGITNYNNRNISQNQHLASKHFSGIIVLRFLLAGAYFITSLIAAFFIGYSEEDIHLLLILLANQFFISFILYLRSNLSGLHLFKSDSLVSVTDRFLMILLCAFLIWSHNGLHLTIENFVYAQTLSYLITALVAIVLLKGKIHVHKLNWQPAFYITILKKSAPFALLILLMTFYSRIDSIMLERMLPDGAFYAGIYAQAYRILDAVNMFGYLFATLLLPMFAHMIKKKQTVQPLTDLSFKLLMIPALTLSCIGLFYATPLMNFLYHHHAELSAPVFSLLMFCFLCISTSYIFGTLLTANGSLKSLNLMALAGMALNIVLNLFLIPTYKASGAAVAGLITQAAMALTQLLLARKILDWKINPKLFLQLFIFTVVLSLIAFALSQYAQGVEMIPVIALISLVTAMLLGLLRLKELKTILAER
jgi:O-antigen/teichoic acid export membrane protein